jgi:hypothetical protein
MVEKKMTIGSWSILKTHTKGRSKGDNLLTRMKIKLEILGSISRSLNLLKPYKQRNS